MPNQYVNRDEQAARRKNDVALTRLEAEYKRLEGTGNHEAILSVLKEINRVNGRAERQEEKRQARLAPKVEKAAVAAAQAAVAEPEAPVRYYPGTDITTNEYLSWVAVKHDLPEDYFDQPAELNGELTEKDKEWLIDFQERKAAAIAAQRKEEIAETVRTIVLEERL